jgi:hypothetical protein
MLIRIAPRARVGPLVNHLEFLGIDDRQSPHRGDNRISTVDFALVGRPF